MRNSTSGRDVIRRRHGKVLQQLASSLASSSWCYTLHFMLDMVPLVLPSVLRISEGRQDWMHKELSRSSQLHVPGRSFLFFSLFLTFFVSFYLCLSLSHSLSRSLSRQSFNLLFGRTWGYVVFTINSNYQSKLLDLFIALLINNWLLVNWLIYCWLIESFILSFLDQLMVLMANWLIVMLINWLIHYFISSFIYSFVRSFTHIK